MNEEQIKYKISDAIHRKDANADAYLFGSRARGDHQFDSDWDILILVEKNKITNEVEDKFRDDLYDIELESEQIISTLIYTKKYWNNTLIYSPLYHKIKKEGIKL